ncbi:hypothetical protein AYL99_11769 [Fonsecaea erecta]|uniref:F-box domain-containing protein n=1 Tax=Fonsecaea erecta TaxID=1367422 RepID=A0A178Z2I2_9EURO|nr:hypothetical protein AYL99_11769 [Fonsecaea erecta]OAP54009.1 hypothetical protein AYL99_11769 [Fonsecaea erecta]
MDSLPDEIVQDIAARLAQAPDALRRFAACGKRYYYISQPILYRDIHLSSLESANLLTRTVRRHQRRTGSGVPSSHLPGMIRRLQLDFPGLSLAKNDINIHAFLRMPSLESLVLVNVSMFPLEQMRLPALNLQHLEVWVMGTREADLCALLSACTSLQSLRLGLLDIFVGVRLLKLVEKFQQSLKEFQLVSPWSRSLRRFRLKGFHQITTLRLTAWLILERTPDAGGEWPLLRSLPPGLQNLALDTIPKFRHRGISVNELNIALLFFIQTESISPSLVTLAIEVAPDDVSSAEKQFTAVSEAAEKRGLEFRVLPRRWRMGICPQSLKYVMQDYQDIAQAMAANGDWA